MKAKILIVCVACLVLAGGSRANGGKPASTGFQAVIQLFIDGNMTYDASKLNESVDENATFRFARGEKIIVQSKADVVNLMKSTGRVDQNCTNSFEVLSKSDGLIMARVDFSYEYGLVQNYIVLEKNEDKEWKITRVYKIFNDVPTASTGQSLTNNPAPADKPASSK